MTYQNEGPSLAKIALITAAATYPGRTAFFVSLGFGLLVLLSPENWEVMVLAWVAFMAYIMVVGFIGKLAFGTAEEVIHGHYQERSGSSAISWFAWIIFLLVAAWFLFGGKARAADSESFTVTAICSTCEGYKALLGAVKILKGDPYGDTEEQVLDHIVSSEGDVVGECAGRKTKHLWKFHVVVPEKDRKRDGEIEIEGDLWVTKQGKLCSASLPFLD